jgi:hypothetical protein
MRCMCYEKVSNQIRGGKKRKNKNKRRNLRSTRNDKADRPE